MSDRDVLKARLLTQGIVLEDDNCLYRDGVLIANDVNLIEGDADCIAFEFDLINDTTDIGMPMKPVAKTLH